MILTWLDRCVRDYLYDAVASPTGTTHSRDMGRRGVADIQNHVNLCRIQNAERPYTSAGPVRKTLDSLHSANLITRRGKRPVQYRYFTGSVSTPGTALAEPKGYKAMDQWLGHPANANTTTTPAPPGSFTTGARRSQLEEMLRTRRDKVVSGEDRPAPAPAKAKLGAIVRPNGQQYFPREIAGKADVEFLRMLRDDRTWPLLSGPPGTGKTSMIEAAFAAGDSEDVILITGDENTSFDDLYGTWVGNGDGNWEWSDGPATQALKQGKVLFIDDITLISPLVLASLYSVLDGRDEVIIKTHMTELDANGQPWADSMKHQEIVRAHDGFFLVGAYNPSTPGALLAPALSSRFKVHLEVTSDYDLAQNAGVPLELVKVARTLDTARTEHRIGWAPQMRELFDAAKVAKKFGMEIALSNLAGIPDDEDDRIFILDTIKKTCGSSMQKLTHLRLGKQI